MQTGRGVAWRVGEIHCGAVGRDKEVRHGGFLSSAPTALRRWFGVSFGSWRFLDSVGGQKEGGLASVIIVDVVGFVFDWQILGWAAYRTREALINGAFCLFHEEVFHRPYRVALFCVAFE